MAFSTAVRDKSAPVIRLTQVAPRASHIRAARSAHMEPALSLLSSCPEESYRSPQTLITLPFSAAMPAS